MWIFVLFGGFFLPGILGQSCNYAQSIGTSPVAIFSPNYPNYYTPGSQCSWQATAFQDYRLELKCTLVEIPNGGSGCPGNYIEISDSNPQGPRRYCGTGTFTEYSYGNQMTVRLSTLSSSAPGRFYCSVRAVFNPCSCGRRKSTRIVGGTTASVNEFPMVVGLYDTSTRQMICSGTLLTNWEALFAAHCLANQSPSSLALVVGEHDITTGVDTSFTAVYQLQSFICYPGTCNVSPGQQGDIALVRTTSEIQMNLGVGVACLPWRYSPAGRDQFAGSRVEAAGWGSTVFGGPNSNTLQKVVLDVITNSQCAQTYGTQITTANICTRTPGRDTCQRDSGAGLLYTEPANGRIYVIGVTDYGQACAAGAPSVSARVTEYLNWISSNSIGQYCNPYP